MTMLDENIKGRKVLAYVDGQYSLKKGSNLYKAIESLGYTAEDIGDDKPADIAIGARRQYRSMGYKMAIVQN
jgi:hypothetical protein